MHPQMLGQRVDPGGQNRYLDLRRPGVVLAPLELLNQLLFLLFGDRHCLLPLAPTEPVLKP